MLKLLRRWWTKAVCAVLLGVPVLSQTIGLRGEYRVQHVRDGVVLSDQPVKNDITNEGKNTLFEIMFHDGSQIASANWAIGLISSAGYSALAATDVMASHAGWTEFTSYSGGVRPAWGPGAAASQSITNSSPVTFNITATGTVLGIFVTSNNTISGTTGKLWSTALFAASVPVNNGDQLRVTYTVSA